VSTGARGSAAPSTAAPRIDEWSWRAGLAGLAALLVGIGLSRFGYAPLVPALIQAGWFDAGEAGYLGATNLAGYIAGAAFARRLADRRSPHRLMTWSMAIGTAAFVACAVPLGFAWYVAWRLASGVIGGVVMVLAAPTILAVTPPERRGLVGGMIFTGVGAGIALSGTLVPWLVRFGLPATWLGLGVASAALTVLAWRGLPRAPASAGAGVAGTTGAMLAPAGPRAHLSPAITVAILSYALSAIGFAPHTVFWVDYVARGLGQGLPIGGVYWVVLGVAAAGGPLLCGMLGDRIGFDAAFRLGLLAEAAALALPIASSHPVALALSSIGVGGLAIGVTALASTRIGALVGVARARQVWGWMTIAYAIAYAAAAYALSFLLVRTGSYEVLFGIGAGALVLGSLVDLLGLRRPSRPG
jgi:predicted MFS family arabinose efflux permease